MKIQAPYQAPQAPIGTSNIRPQIAQPGRSPLFTIVALLIIVAVAGWGGYLYLQKTATAKEITTIEGERAELEKKLADLETEKLDYAARAKDVIKLIEADEIPWSDVITKVKDLTPVDENGTEKIIFSAYSGAAQGALSLNATTLPARGTSSAKQVFDDIAELIKVFNESRIFQNGFVPSIAKGLTEDGSVVLTFSFLTEYSPQKVKRTPVSAKETLPGQ